MIIATARVKYGLAGDSIGELPKSTATQVESPTVWSSSHFMDERGFVFQLRSEEVFELESAQVKSKDIVSLVFLNKYLHGQALALDQDQTLNRDRDLILN